MISTILDCPDELLLQICDGLDPSHLCELALSCKRLHLLALSVCFSRCKTPFPSTSISLSGRNISALRALRISLTTSTLETLTCRFPRSHIVGNVLDLRHLILRTPRLREIVIGFESEIAVAELYLYGSIAGKSFEALERLLLAAVQNCYSLTLVDSYQGRRDLSSPLNLPRTSVQTLQIISSMVMKPRASKWINRSSITHLCIRYLGPSPTYWDELLNGLAIPTLTELAIICISISARDLLDFLSRHPLVNSLSLYQLQPHTDDPEMPPSALPQLTTLSATSAYLRTFLRSVKTLPRLRALSMHPRGEILGCTDVEDLFELIAPRTEPITLSLTLSNDDDFCTWLDLDERPIKMWTERLLQCVSTLRLRTVSDRFRFSQDTLELIPSWLALFPALRSVKFRAVCLPSFSTDEKLLFVASIHKVCPDMTVVGLGEENRTMTEWLSIM